MLIRLFIWKRFFAVPGYRGGGKFRCFSGSLFLGAFFVTFSSILALLGGGFGRLWAHFGGLGGHFDRHWGAIGMYFGPAEVPFGVLGSSKASIWRSLRELQETMQIVVFLK